MACEAKPDALAVSVGNVHLQTSHEAMIDRAALAKIETVVHCPLVLHGVSGINFEDRRWLATQTSVCKFNIGTELRKKFGLTLRQVLQQNPNLYDRNKILSSVKPELIKTLKAILKSLSNKA